MRPATILRIHSIISSALDLAVRYDWADRNVAKNASPPYPRKREPKRRARTRPRGCSTWSGPRTRSSACTCGPRSRLDVTGREYAGRVQAGCARIATLLDDLLHLSQVTQAKMNLQDVDLSAEVTAICDQLHARDPGRQVRVTMQEGVQATADRALIRYALDHLLENAWKFTARRDGAAIEFATAPIGEAPICCYPVLALRTRPCRPCRCRPVHVVALAVGGVRRGSPGWSRTRGSGR